MPFVLSAHEHGTSIPFMLDGTDGCPSAEVAAEYAATRAREKLQDIHALPQSILGMGTPAALYALRMSVHWHSGCRLTSRPFLPQT
jgi:hypothetical protein